MACSTGKAEDLIVLLLEEELEVICTRKCPRDAVNLDNLVFLLCLVPPEILHYVACFALTHAHSIVVLRPREPRQEYLRNMEVEVFQNSPLGFFYARKNLQLRGDALGLLQEGSLRVDIQ